MDEELKNTWKSDRTFAQQEDGLLTAQASWPVLVDKGTRWETCAIIGRQYENIRYYRWNEPGKYGNLLH